MFIIGGFRLLMVVVDEILVLGLFIGVIDILVEVDIYEFCIMDGDGLGCMKEVGLFNIGGFGLFVMVVDEILGMCVGMVNILDDIGGVECVIVINGGLIVLLDKGGVYLKDVDFIDDDLLFENFFFIFLVSLVFKFVMVVVFFVFVSLKFVLVFRDFSLMMVFSFFFLVFCIWVSLCCFFFSFNIFIFFLIFCCFFCFVKVRVS